MIDNKCEAYLIQEYGEFDYKSRLRDFTNAEVRKVLMSKVITNRYMLFYALYKSTDDPEAQAHALGFESNEARQQTIAKIKAKQAKLKD
jgi:hypothetical protein